MRKIKSHIKHWITKAIGKTIVALDLDVFMPSLHSAGYENGPGFHESGEYNLIFNILPSMIDNPNAIFFDVGAHRGEYATMLKKSFPESRIYAFEPNPENMVHLKKFEGNIIPSSVAIDSAPGDFKLYVSPVVTIHDPTKLGSGNKKVFSEIYHTDNIQTIACHADSLDNFCDSNSIKHIDFLKIDTEGNELNALAGAKRLLTRGSISIIQFEFNEMNMLSRTFMRDFEDILPNFKFFRLTRNKLRQMTPRSKYNEIFTFHNVVAIRNDLCNRLPAKMYF